MMFSISLSTAGEVEVQIRLVAIKHMPILLNPPRRPGPDALLHAGKHGGVSSSSLSDQR